MLILEPLGNPYKSVGTEVSPLALIPPSWVGQHCLGRNLQGRHWASDPEVLSLVNIKKGLIFLMNIFFYRIDQFISLSADTGLALMNVGMVALATKKKIVPMQCGRSKRSHSDYSFTAEQW